MGTFRIEIQALGGHGCDRSVKNETIVTGCGKPTCPDCLAREFVGKLRKIGCSFEYASSDVNHDCYARLTHWPGQATCVVDDLLTGIRRGNF